VLNLFSGIRFLFRWKEKPRLNPGEIDIMFLTHPKCRSTQIPSVSPNLMKKTLLRFLLAGLFACIFSMAAHAQIKKIPAKTLEITKDVTFFVVGQSAKLTGEAAKVAAPIMLKAAGKTAVFTLKQSKNVMLKAVIPASRQLIVKYLKYRLMP
jgi:hypothetical protein